MPGVAVVNEQGQVLEIRGDMGPYFRPAPGKPAFTLLKMFQQDLIPDLEAGIREVRESGARVRREHVRLRSGDSVRELSIEIRPLPGPTPRDPYYLLVFEESRQEALPATPPAPAKGPGRDARDLEIERLQRALEANRDYQQTIIEKIESSNEELRTSHEEVLSSNEELQSSNEELETAKEELQSTNEELTTLNEELRHRNEELDGVNADLANVLAGIQIPIAIIDRSLRIRRVTPAGEKFLNIMATDVDRRITDFQPSFDLPELGALISEAISRQTVVEREVRDHDGRWHSLRIHPHKPAGDSPEGAVLTIVDIDAVKRIALDNERARALSEAVFDAVPNALLVLDSELRILRANEAYCDLLKVTREETEQHRFDQVGGGVWNIPELKNLLQEVVPKDSRFGNFATEREFPNIGHKLILLHAQRLRSWPTEVPVMVLAFEDITQRHRAETEVRHLTSTLEKRVQDRTMELQESKGEMEAFTYSVAHDLRTPLRAMHQFAQILLEDYRSKPLDAEGRQCLQRIIAASGKMDLLVQDLLSYSRLTRETLPMEDLDPKPVIDDLLSDLAPLIKARGAVVKVQGRFGPVRSNRPMLFQSLTNLVSNALKFVAPGVQPEVLIRGERRDGFLRIWVEDNGIGIDPAHHERIFRVFERLHGGEAYPGTGIGLAIVRKAMEHMNGRVGVESEPGKGSRFYVDLRNAEKPES